MATQDAQLTPDASVTDPLVLAEIEMYGDLVIAASASVRPLTAREIDRVLGVEPPAAAPRAQRGRRARRQPKRPEM